MTEAPGGLATRGYVSTATHCPFEGEQDPDWVAHLVETLLEWGVDHVYLGETIGKATPAHIERLLDEVLIVSPVERVGIHLHDTYGQAIANTVTALERGIDKMDASAGGLGGCPYAPGSDRERRDRGRPLVARRPRESNTAWIRRSSPLSPETSVSATTCPTTAGRGEPCSRLVTPG